MKGTLLFVCFAMIAITAAFTVYDAEAEAGAAVMEAAAAEIVAASTQVGDTLLVSAVRWTRPEGPIRVALQAGHWLAAEAPDEQAGLRANGTRGGGKAEWEVNLSIADRTATLLRQAGYVVDILPTTIPPGYWADLFISIHADGSTSSSASGYRAAAPRRDATGRAAEFVTLLESTYGEATGLPHYPTVTRRMRGYYAFNSRRYHHALHPMTVGVILETGFLTNAQDRRVIVDDQDRAARGIAEAVKLYLEPNRPEPTVVARSSASPSRAETNGTATPGRIVGPHLPQAEAAAASSEQASAPTLR